jgi:prepilin-type N-terminal cleavage/methylation domain-containing protein
MTHTFPRSSSPALRSARGFTLAELLLASVLGAMLLTALAVSTFGFTSSLDYLEAKAGVGGDIDPVLRRMTRDIREAWLVEQPEPDRLALTHPDGDVTEYRVEDGNLVVKRPNGDEGVVYSGLESFAIDTATAPRKREGPAVIRDGAWLAKAAGASPIAYTVPVDGALALGFVAPSMSEEVSGLGVAEEQVVAVASSVVELPIAWVNGTAQHQLQVQLFESWAPGKAKPYGTPLATLNIPGSSIPQATGGAGSYNVPSEMVPITLPATLTPGTGYTVVAKVLGNSQIVTEASFAMPGPLDDEVAVQSVAGGGYVVQAVTVPFKMKGTYQTTSTVASEVISRVTIVATPEGKTPQQRSASVLSQAYTDDPWLGTVPGQTAP